MKAKYLLFSLLSTTVLAQTETSFSGISSDSTRILLEDTENNEDNSFAYFKTYVGKTNGDYWYLHSKPQLEDEEGLAARLHAVQFTRDAEYFLPETKGYNQP